MSYILEALKKAEQQRGLGRVPGLDSVHEQVRGGARRRWLWALTGVLILNAAVLLVVVWPEQWWDRRVELAVQSAPPPAVYPSEALSEQPLSPRAVQAEVPHSTGEPAEPLQFPVPADDGENTIIHEVGLTVVDRALVIGNGSLVVDYVQAAVNNQSPPAFYESRPFRDMVARVPAEACSYAVSDLSAYVRFLADEIRTAAARTSAPSIIAVVRMLWREFAWMARAMWRCVTCATSCASTPASSSSLRVASSNSSSEASTGSASWAISS